MSWFAHVIVSPTFTVVVPGLNLKSLIVTPLDAAACTSATGRVLPWALARASSTRRGTSAGAALMSGVASTDLAGFGGAAGAVAGSVAGGSAGADALVAGPVPVWSATGAGSPAGAGSLAGAAVSDSESVVAASSMLFGCSVTVRSSFASEF